MSTQKSTVTKGNTVNGKAAKQQVNNNATTTRRVVETRDQWQVIFDYSAKLIAAYCRNQKPSDPRSGFGFGKNPMEQPHIRAYAKSLIWGFASDKAAKVLKHLDIYLPLDDDETIHDFLDEDEEIVEGLSDKAYREKIAIAILSDCKLVKGDSKAIEASLNKVERKREVALMKSVLLELTKPTEPTTKGGKDDDESQPKAEKDAPKGGKSSTKGGKKSEKPAAPKGSKAEGKAATTKGGKDGKKTTTKGGSKSGKASKD